MKNVRATTIDTFKCPCCSLLVSVSRSEGGQEFLLHPMPACEGFIEKPEAEYRELVMRSRAS